MSEQSRLDGLEGRVEELSRHWDHLFGEIGRLDQRFDGADRRCRCAGAARSIAVSTRSIEKWTMFAQSYRGSFGGRSARCWRCWA